VTGTYQWNATYSGDANNASSADNNNANEQVVVKGRPESTTTSMNIAKGNVTYGAEAIQTINGVVTGQKNDGAPEGGVNVTYGPSATPLCSATLVAGTGDTSTYKCALTSNTQLNAFNYLTVRATFVPATVSSTSANFVYTTSMSGAFSGDNFLVKKDSTTTKVTVSPNSVTSGAESSAVFSVSVKTGNGETVPNGEIVTVKVGSTSCMVTLSAGGGHLFHCQQRSRCWYLLGERHLLRGHEPLELEWIGTAIDGEEEVAADRKYAERTWPKPGWTRTVQGARGPATE